MKTEIEIERMQAELAKLRAEVRKERLWYPLGVTAAPIAAIGTVIAGAVGLGILIGRVWGKL